MKTPRKFRNIKFHNLVHDVEQNCDPAVSRCSNVWSAAVTTGYLGFWYGLIEASTRFPDEMDDLTSVRTSSLGILIELSDLATGHVCDDNSPLPSHR